MASALAVTAHTPDQTGDAVLAWIVGNDHRPTRPEPNVLMRRWQHCTPQLTGRVLALLDDKLHVCHRLAYATPTPRPRLPQTSPARPTRRATTLPALLWPKWSIRLIPAANTSHNGHDSTRAALAALTLIPGSRLTYQQAVDLLGGYTSGAAVRSVLEQIPADQLAATITLLTQLADTLDGGSPVDYTRRRALFATGTAVDRSAYAALAAEHGWQPPSQLQLHILDRHLVTLLIGAAGDTRVGPTRCGAADAFNPLLSTLPAAARQFVHDQARQLLDAHHIHEPITWQPLLPDHPDAPWPGIDPATLDRHRFATAFAQAASAPHPLGRLHSATGMSTIHIRLYTEILGLDMPGTCWDTLAADPGGDLLDPSRLRHLYHDRQLALRDIARRSLTTERVVRQALTEAGTTLLSARPHRSDITREWFEQHYLNTGKTVRQAAREAGTSPTTLRHYARQHGIPFGRTAPPANPFASWPTHHMPPPAVIAACTGRNHIDHLRQVLQMPGHRTRRAAAAALGLHDTVLMRHRQHIEHAAAIRIFQPGTPLVPTPEAKQFLHQAAKALRRLDKQHNHQHRPHDQAPPSPTHTRL